MLPDDGRSISLDVTSLNILAHDIMFMNNRTDKQNVFTYKGKLLNHMKRTTSQFF